MIEILYSKKGEGLRYPVMLRQNLVDVAYGSAAAHLDTFAGAIEQAVRDAVDTVVDARHLKPSQTISLVQRIRDATEKLYMKKNVMEEVARSVGYTPDYIRRIWREETGTRYHEYLQEVRLRFARRKLLFTSLPVGEIGRSVGYGNVQYFSDLFLQHYGIHPSDERRRSLPAAKYDIIKKTGPERGLSGTDGRKTYGDLL